MHNYLHALASGWPTRQVHSTDGGVTYAGLVADDALPLPTEAELDAYILDKAKLAKWEQIKAYRELRRQSGVTASGYWFHSDDTSRIQIMALTMLGANLPAGIMWKTMPNTFVEMTPTLAQQVFQTILNGDMNNFAVAEQHRQQMLAAPDPDAYDFTVNPSWPAVYGE